MLKLLGSILIGTASIGLALRITGELKEHLALLYEVRQLFVDIAGEAAYSLQPVEHILGSRIRVRDARLMEICGEIAEKLAMRRDAKGEEVWAAVFEEHKKLLGLKEAELAVIRDAGKAFFGKSMEENEKNLAAYLERLDFLIEGRRREQEEKQKVIQTVSVMCGLMLIILLI